LYVTHRADLAAIDQAAQRCESFKFGKLEIERSGDGTGPVTQPSRRREVETQGLLAKNGKILLQAEIYDGLNLTGRNSNTNRIKPVSEEPPITGRRRNIQTLRRLSRLL
jgi:hypothetical protein